jgi:hypothetical protein
VKEKIKMLISAKSTGRKVPILENYQDLYPVKEGYDSEKRFFWTLISKNLSLI